MVSATQAFDDIQPINITSLWTATDTQLKRWIPRFPHVARYKGIDFDDAVFRTRSPFGWGTEGGRLQ